PDSEYYTESIYRLGTVYFELALDARNPQEFYSRAIEYFDVVANQTGDPLQHYGLFQRGWSNFSSGKFERAIEDFSRILEIIEVDSLRTRRAFFEADAIENIAFSLIEYDGTDYDQASVAAAKAKEIFTTFVNDDYGKLIIRKAIALELTYSAPMRAIDLYNSYIHLYPLSKECPTYIDSIITIYQRYPERVRNDQQAEDLIILQKVRLVQDYRIDSEWYIANRNRDIPVQLGIIREAYEFLEPKYYNNFVYLKNEDNYLSYKELITNYAAFDEFRDETGLQNLRRMRKNLIDLSTNLAETTQEPAFYFYVLNDISSYNSYYPENDNFYDYEEDKFYSYEKIYELLLPRVAEEPYQDSLHNIYMDKNELESFYIAATINYETILNSPDYSNEYKESELIRITQLRAELRYFRDEYSDAFNDYEHLLSYQIDNDLRTETFARMAEISRIREDYKAEEDYYRQALLYCTEEEKEAFTNNVLASIQAQANQLGQLGNHYTAAEEYLRLAGELENRDLNKSIGFRVKAIESYKKVGEYEKAIDQYLEIAARRESNSEEFAAYMGAFTISDSLMQDWQLSESLRYRYILKYPYANETYRLRLQIISFYEDESRFNDKMRAAEMYLDLYEDSAEMDIGTDSRENIYLRAIAIYKEMAMTDLEIEHMIRFEKLYPEHPLANTFLQRVALIYDERNETEKFEDLARYIYRKDPSIDLFTAIIAEKLKVKNDEIDSLFAAQEYEQMAVKIDEFRDIDSAYKADGGNIDLTSFYDQFDYYTAYVNFHQRYQNKLENIEQDFLVRTPDQMIRVNENTEWKRHIINDRRIEKVMEEADQIKADIIALIQEGNNYDLDTESKTHGLYLAARSYDHASNAVDIQITKFVDVSNQLNNEQMRENPVQQQQYKENLLSNGKKLSFDFKKKANELYQYLLITFYDDQDYNDQWTDLAYERLVEWGVRNPKVYQYAVKNSIWKMMSSYRVDRNIPLSDEIWVNLETDSIATDADSTAQIFTLDSVEETLLAMQMDAEIIPELIKINYRYLVPVEIFINGEPLDKIHTKIENEEAAGEYSEFQVSYYKYLKKGKNVILFKINKPPFRSEESLFTTSVVYQYDQEELDYHRSTEEIMIVSDYNWNSQLTAEGSETPDQEAEWKAAGQGYFSFYQRQIYGLEESKALPIWYPMVDTTMNVSAFFKREFTVTGEVLEAKALYLGQNKITIWINGVKFVNGEDIILDPKMGKALSQELFIPNLMTGDNTILIRVDGNIKYKGLIFELIYIQKKDELTSADPEPETELQLEDPDAYTAEEVQPEE
ncbi:MAG: hypothetical protein JW996_04525, partial [Candidatus Cloacimonetes bacterium]|nr:hypothetical protein [Candidatus Cloacimonadota bacterium]